jgi:hypothetical protein
VLKTKKDETLENSVELPKCPYPPENIGSVMKIFTGLFSDSPQYQNAAKELLENYESRAGLYPERSGQRFFLEDMLGIAYDHQQSREAVRFLEEESINFANNARKRKAELANEIVKISNKTAGYTRTLSTVLVGLIGYVESNDIAFAGALATLSLFVTEGVLRIGSKIYKIHSNQKADNKISEARETYDFLAELVYDAALYHVRVAYNSYIDQRYVLPVPEEFYKELRERKREYMTDRKLKGASPVMIKHMQAASSIVDVALEDKKYHDIVD